MGQAAIVLMLAGTAMSAVGAAKEGEAQKEAANANARLAKIDADNQTERISRMQEMGAELNVTRIAKSGVRMEGSPLDVLVYNASEAARQQASIRRSYTAYANIQHKIGQAAVEASRWQIAGSVLRGVGSAFGGSQFTFAGGGDYGWGAPNVGSLHSRFGGTS